MVLAAVTKTPSYFSRYQVKYRRRREGKTDYQQRRNLIKQDLNKYQTKKYRFIVRFTNSKVICQVAYATLSGDIIVASADSSELTRFGMPVGLTNYAAAYATGLLCARKCLKHFDLDKDIPIRNTLDGEEYRVEDQDFNKTPLRAVLDVGLSIVTRGNRVFGALKGACDGGLSIPHSIKRFPGYDPNSSDGAYDAELHRERIMGIHVTKYMKKLQEEDPEKYNRQFSRYIKLGITPENLESKIQAVHDAIRANPNTPKAEPKQYKITRENNYIVTYNAKGEQIKYFRPKKLTKAQRMERVQMKIAEVARLASEAMAN
ncbi:large ribosomal subunit protein uL18-like [Dermatophagoides farinae]|uniref:large ribosomal subunit protein uL18-like n=1 Tax=Dermatophagoides farinae TaxID=6954 RepID=UPI003F60D0B1